MSRMCRDGEGLPMKMICPKSLKGECASRVSECKHAVAHAKSSYCDATHHADCPACVEVPQPNNDPVLYYLLKNRDKIAILLSENKRLLDKGQSLQKNLKSSKYQALTLRRGLSCENYFLNGMIRMAEKRILDNKKKLHQLNKARSDLIQASKEITRLIRHQRGQTV